MRRTLFVANWKMHMTTATAEAFVRELVSVVSPDEAVEIVIAPPVGLLSTMRQALGDRDDIALAVQNVYWEDRGAYTGETSIELAADLGCRYVLIGHSERRTLFAESDDDVAQKVTATLRAGLRAIVCVGEALEDREAQRTMDVIKVQLENGLPQLLPDQLGDLVVAYEPIWAIGTGRTATPDIAQEVHAFIREQLGNRFGEPGRHVRIQYGGSVKPANVADIMAEPDIDGALVGGAGLDAKDFAHIIHFDEPDRLLGESLQESST